MLLKFKESIRNVCKISATGRAHHVVYLVVIDLPLEGSNILCTLNASYNFLFMSTSYKISQKHWPVLYYIHG